MDKETQVLTEYKSVEIMTDPYNPHQEELRQLKQQRDEYVKIHKEGKAYCEKLIRDFREKENQWKHREGELSSLHHDLDQQRTSWTVERDSLHDEIRDLKQDAATRDSKETELKDTILAQGVKVNEIAKLATEQRDKDLSEIKRFMAAAERYRRGQEESQQRARVAEVEILNSREQAASHRLERAVKEATYHSQHLAGFIKKHEEKSVPPALKQTLDHWKLVVEKCGQSLLQLKAEYENQRTEISNGKKLSDLDPIRVPSPPPMPEAIKQLMGNAATMGNLMPRMASPHHVDNSHAGAISPTIPQMPRALTSPTGHRHGTPSPTTQMPQPAFGPFPTTGPRPLLMPPRPNVPGSKQPMTSFEKLMLKLQTLFPNYESSDFKKYIQELRQGRGGSLSGMTIEDITNQIAEIIHNREKQKASIATAAAQGKKQMAAPPGLNTSWAFTPDKKKAAGAGTRAGEDYFQEEEDPCVICHEEMARGVTTTLECGHKFHDECIRKWFKEQSTCPNCRVHALLSDDFPTLG